MRSSSFIFLNQILNRWLLEEHHLSLQLVYLELLSMHSQLLLRHLKTVNHSLTGLLVDQLASLRLDVLSNLARPVSVGSSFTH